MFICQMDQKKYDILGQTLEFKHTNLKEKFSTEEWQKIKKDSVKAPLWVYNYISEIAGERDKK